MVSADFADALEVNLVRVIGRLETEWFLSRMLNSAPLFNKHLLKY